jgi:hypothetical protein
MPYRLLDLGIQLRGRNCFLKDLHKRELGAVFLGQRNSVSRGMAGIRREFHGVKDVT